MSFGRGDDGVGQGMIDGGRATFLWQAFAKSFDRFPCQFRVAAHLLDHLCNVHRLGIVLLAVVVGNHGQKGIGQFRFASEPGFGHGRHSDHFGTPMPVQAAFGTS